MVRWSHKFCVTSRMSTMSTSNWSASATIWAFVWSRTFCHAPRPPVVWTCAKQLIKFKWLFACIWTCSHQFRIGRQPTMNSHWCSTTIRWRNSLSCQAILLTCDTAIYYADAFEEHWKWSNWRCNRGLFRWVSICWHDWWIAILKFNDDQLYAIFDIEQDQLKGDGVTELRVKFLRRLEDSIPAGED